MCSGIDIEESERDYRSPRMLRCEIIDAQGYSHPAFVKNISRHGLGGSGCEAIWPGQQVTVIFPELATVTGTVRWSAHGKFGILLDQEIVPELVRFVPPKNAAAPKFKVSPLHRPVTDWTRPGFDRAA
jgi:hypothetical protein